MHELWMNFLKKGKQIIIIFLLKGRELQYILTYWLWIFLFTNSRLPSSEPFSNLFSNDCACPINWGLSWSKIEGASSFKKETISSSVLATKWQGVNFWPSRVFLCSVLHSMSAPNLLLKYREGLKFFKTFF